MKSSTLFLPNTINLELHGIFAQRDLAQHSHTYVMEVKHRPPRIVLGNKFHNSCVDYEYIAVQINI